MPSKAGLMGFSTAQPPSVEPFCGTVTGAIRGRGCHKLQVATSVHPWATQVNRCCCHHGHVYHGICNPQMGNFSHSGSLSRLLETNRAYLCKLDL